MATTARGHIEPGPRAGPSSGSFRVNVYAGSDPVTGKPRRLKQTCPDEATAAAALGKLLAQADGDHFPNREAVGTLPTPGDGHVASSRAVALTGALLPPGQQVRTRRSAAPAR